MATRDSNKVWYTPDLTGGVETRLRPTRLAPNQSPDLSNVTLNQGAVSKRGGFTPFVKQHGNLNSVRNAATVEATASLRNDVDASTAVRTVPGHLLGGHRDVFEDLSNGVLLDFFLRIDDLSQSTVTALADNPGGVDSWFGPNGDGQERDILIRPIISKGPIKKTMEGDRFVFYGNPATNWPYGAETFYRGQNHWNLFCPWGVEGEILAATATDQGGGTTRIIPQQPFQETLTPTTSRVYIIGSTNTATPTQGTNDGVHVVTAVASDNTWFEIATPAGAFDSNGFTVSFEPPHKDYGMPWAVYVQNDAANTGAVPDWTIKLACHSIEGTNFGLYILSSSVEVEVGGTYHVLASIDWGGNVILRVGRYNAALRRFVYVADSLAMDASATPPRVTQGPVQVFDIPQEFIEGPTGTRPLFDASSFLSRPPGLGITQTGADGGYFNAVKRMEGAIEDIVIWRQTLSGEDDETYDRIAKLDLEFPPADVGSISAYWPMTDGSDRIIREGTSRYGHLYMAPDFPILDAQDGGVQSNTRAAWWFNGLTSYAMADLKNNPNWRTRARWDEEWGQDVPSRAYIDRVFRGGLNGSDGLSLGFQIEFTCDSIEPFEQVLAEIHSGLRCVIRPDGRIAVYFRYVEASQVDDVLPRYSHAVYSRTRIRPGRRYNAQFIATGQKYAILLNGIPDVISASGGNGIPPNAPPIGGLTFGMGSRHANTFNPSTYTLPDENAINTDSRSGFIGKIEQVKLLVGGIRGDHSTIKDESPDDWRVDLARLWATPYPQQSLVVVDSASEAGILRRRNISNVPLDRAAGPPKQPSGLGLRISGFQDFYTTTQGGQLGASDDLEEPDVVVPPLQTAGLGGQNGVSYSAAEPFANDVQVFKCVARWVLDQSSEDEGVWANRYVTGIEYRIPHGQDRAITGQGGGDSFRYVATQVTPVRDNVGAFGTLIARCVESDILTEAMEGRTELTIRPSRDACFLFGGAWGISTPREIGPRWSAGLVRSSLTDTRVSLLASWDDNRSDERFVLAATGRNLYWAKQVWRGDSPFGGDDRSVWLFGQPGEHIFAQSELPAQEFDGDDLVVEVWVKPFRLDGTRVIATRQNTQNGRINYFLGSWNGSLFVCGSADSGSESWFYHEGENRSDDNTPDMVDGTARLSESRLGEVSLRLNAWNHIHILLSDSGPMGWVNGAPIKLTALDGAGRTGAFTPDGFTGSVLDTDTSGNFDLFLAGLPAGFEFVSLNTKAESGLEADSWRFPVQAWCGAMTEFRSRAAADPAFVSGQAGGVPLARYPTDTDAAAGFLLHLNEGQGWVFRNDIAPPSIPPGFNSAISQITELVPIAEGLSDSRRARYQSVIYRDRFYMTNGADRVKEIRFGRLSTDEPFLVHNCGMLPPVTHPNSRLRLFSCASSRLPADGQHDTFPSGEIVPIAAPVLGVSDVTQPPDELSPGVYQYWVSFYDDIDRESEPVLYDTVTVPPRRTFLRGELDVGTQPEFYLEENAVELTIGSTQTSPPTPISGDFTISFGSLTTDPITIAGSTTSTVEGALNAAFTGTEYGVQVTLAANPNGDSLEDDGTEYRIVIFNTRVTSVWSVDTTGSVNGTIAITSAAATVPPSTDGALIYWDSSASRFIVEFGDQVQDVYDLDNGYEQNEYITVEVRVGADFVPYTQEGQPAPTGPGVLYTGYYCLRLSEIATTATGGQRWYFPGITMPTGYFARLPTVDAEPLQVSFRVVPMGSKLDILPRSIDRQVVGRRFYVPPSGGGVPIYHSDVTNNTAANVELVGGGRGPAALELQRRLVPPRARNISVGANSLILSVLPELEAGRSAFAYSEPQEVSYFPFQNLALLDSEDGKSIVGQGSNLGRVYLSKRDSVWALVPAGGNQLSAVIVNQSAGIGGGLVAYDDVFFGGGDRGIYRFDGSNMTYWSGALESLWPDVDVSDEAMLNQFGVFHRDESQYWLSVRSRVGGVRPSVNNTIYVLHTQVGQGQSWTKFDVPGHTYMANITDPLTQRPEILLGCDDGRILKYDREVFVDGSDDRPAPRGIEAGETAASLLAVSDLSVASRNLVLTSDIPAYLDTVLDGLRGMPVTLVEGTSLASFSRRIVWNFQDGSGNDVITLNDEVPAGTYFLLIGAYSAYYTTPWVGSDVPGEFLSAHSIDLEFEPDQSLAFINWTSAGRNEAVSGSIPAVSGPLAAAGAKVVDLQNGWLPHQILLQQEPGSPTRGRYFRFQVSTFASAYVATDPARPVPLGIRNPWTFTGLGFRYKTEGHMGYGGHV